MARRLFGWIDDATVGGKNLGQLRVDENDLTEVPSIPDPTQMWPVTNVTVDKGVTNLERTDEVRAVRGNAAPQEFRRAPTVSVSGRLYFPVLRKLLRLWTGGTPSTAGGSGTPITGVTAASSTNTFTKTAHGLTNGQLVILSALTGGSGLTAGVPYYVIAAAANTFQLALEVGGAAVALGTDVTDVTVTNPAATTTTYPVLAYGAAGLPAVHLAVVRDDLYERVAGCVLSELQLSFPLDNHATFQATFAGKYYRQEDETPPAVDYSTYLRPDAALVLRDANMFLDGSGTAIDGLAGLDITLNNSLRDPDFYPGKNILRVPAAGGDRERVLWWPAVRKLGSAQEITGSLNFSDVKTAQETKLDLARAQQAVFEVSGGALGTSTPSRQLLRMTAYALALNGGGASALVREGDITSEYQFGAYLNAQNQDVKFEVVDAT